MSNLGKFVVFWNTAMGTNTHHFFDDYEAAAKYCAGNRSPGQVIAYVVSEAVPPPPHNTVDKPILDYLTINTKVEKEGKKK